MFENLRNDPKENKTPEKKISRRDFLKIAAGAGAALAFESTLLKNLEAKEVPSPKDLDTERRDNKEFMESNGIVFRQESVEIGNETFILSILSKNGLSSQNYFVCHDSEDAAFDTALRAIKDGGKVIAIESKDGEIDNGDDRYLYSFGENKHRTACDPNLIFDRHHKYWPLAEKILSLLEADKKKMIISLHNTGRGGKLTLESVRSRTNALVLSQKDPNIRNMIWITGTQKNPSEETKKEAEYYKAQGLNVVYEYIDTAKKGNTSFSVFATKNGIPYRNIEILAGLRGNAKSESKSLEVQTKYLSAVRSYGNNR